MTLSGWTREPLVHFLIAGGLLYALLTWGGEPVDPSSRVIDVDREVQAELALRFERTMGRAPTDAELDAQIERFVRDEVLYREALRLGLDQGDAVVRQRLVSKMDMAASAAAEAAQPSEEQLRAFFEDNRERYRTEVKVSFDQIFFGENGADAFAARRQINRGADPSSLGERSSLPPSLENVSLREVGDRFGSEFAEALSAMEPNENDWSSEARSGFGFHVVRLRAKSGGDVADFDTVSEQVANDWRTAEIADRKQRAFQILRDAYRVNIDR